MSKTLARDFEFQHCDVILDNPLKFYTMYLMCRSSYSSKAEQTPPFLFIWPIIWPRSNLDCQIRLNSSISQPPAYISPKENLAFWRYALYRHTFLFLLRNNNKKKIPWLTTRWSRNKGFGLRMEAKQRALGANGTHIVAGSEDNFVWPSCFE